MSKLTDAAKADILSVLDKQDLSAHEFNRVINIAKTCSALCNAAGSYNERVIFAEALSESEYKAPQLHELLKSMSFDGQTVLKNKYGELSALHANLKSRAIDLTNAESSVAQQKKVLALKEEMLQEDEERLEREKQRLMLSFGGALPVLPSLESPEEASEGSPSSEEKA